MGVDEPGLDVLARVGFDTLGLQTYLTAGPKEARAWTIRQGATAPQAAGVIHSDFERGFIRAETIAYEDYVAGNGEAGAREAGRFRVEGKGYEVQDGDVVFIKGSKFSRVASVVDAIRKSRQTPGVETRTA